MGAGSYRLNFDAIYKFIFDLQKIFAEVYEIWLLLLRIPCVGIFKKGFSDTNNLYRL